MRHMQSAYLRDGGAAKWLGIRWQSRNRRAGAETRDRRYADMGRCPSLSYADWILVVSHLPVTQFMNLIASGVRLMQTV